MHRLNIVALCGITGVATAGAVGLLVVYWRRSAKQNAPKSDDDPLNKQLLLSLHVSAAQNRTATVWKYLTPYLVERLQFQRTSNDANLFDVLRTGFGHTIGRIGCLAVDAECYSVFDDLFDSVICDCQDHFALHLDRQPDVDFGEKNIDQLTLFDHVVSFRLQLSRNLTDVPFLPLMDEEELKRAEERIVNACAHLQIDPQLRGKYMRLGEVDDKLKEQLLPGRMIFGLDDPVLKAAGAYKHGSKGRGLYLTTDRSLVVFVNEMDHLTIVSVNTPGENGQLRPAYERLVRAHALLERHLLFARDRRLGMLTVSPDRVGTGFVASARMRLPVLSRRPDLPALVKEIGLRERVDETTRTLGSSVDEKARTFDGVHELETPKTLGLTEWAIVCHLHEAVGRLLIADKQEQCPTFMHMFS